MINLAGDKKCDEIIREELKIAGIPIIELNSSMNSEVPASVIGYINGFKFKRAWYYWMVEGYMPLEYARQMYDKYKDLDIRVSGHCMNPAPEEWCEPKGWFDKCKPIVDRYLNEQITYEECNELCNEIKNQGDQYITHYHIDTQEGLCRFSETIIYNNIVSER
jgi:hypothetical protein